MKIKEIKIATYTENKIRVQLLKITSHPEVDPKFIEYMITIKYQIRVNRKRVYTTGFEYDARKYFATIIQNDILQLKIY